MNKTDLDRLFRLAQAANAVEEREERTGEIAKHRVHFGMSVEMAAMFEELSPESVMWLIIACKRLDA